MGREEAADQRPGDTRKPEDCTEDSLVAAAIAGWYDVSDRRLRGHHQPTPAEPLDCAKRDQLRQVLRQATQDRADQEHDQTNLEHDLAAVLIA